MTVAPVIDLITQAENAATSMAEAPSAALMFERLARDPNVPVDKLERLIALQERVMAHNAESAFNIAFSEMQAEIPTIKERAHTDKTSYATLEDIIGAVRPILSKHGFTISHRTEWPDKKTVKVIGLLTHRDGHTRTSEFMADADQTGSKNAIQALGSSVSYGKRYTAKDLLCIVTSDEDDDGQESERHKEPAEPDGYAAWIAKLQEAAMEGTAAHSVAFNAGPEPLRKFLTTKRKADWEKLKVVASTATQAINKRVR